MPNFEKLSESDKAVLKSIFDPNAAIGEIKEDEDVFLDDTAENPQEATAEGLQAKELEVLGVRSAERGDHSEALELFHRVVALAPERAAGYNNRAQLLRLLGKEDEAMCDLNKALELTAGDRTRARAQALCQRGVLLRKQGLDGAARRDFTEAAGLGSAFAKKQVVELNPYAALCNKMLHQVMNGETNPKI